MLWHWPCLQHRACTAVVSFAKFTMCMPNINTIAVYFEASVTLRIHASRSCRRSLVPEVAHGSYLYIRRTPN